MRGGFVDQQNSLPRTRANRSVTFCDVNSYNQNHYKQYQRLARSDNQDFFSAVHQPAKDAASSYSSYSSYSIPHLQTRSSFNSPSAIHSFIPESKQLAADYSCNCIINQASGSHVLSTRNPPKHLNNYYSYADPITVIVPPASETHEYSLPAGNIKMTYSDGSNMYSNDYQKPVFFTNSQSGFFKYLCDCNLFANRPSQFASFTLNNPHTYSSFIFTVIAAIIVVLMLFTSFLLFQRFESSSLGNSIELDENPCEKMSCPFGGSCVIDSKLNRPTCQCLVDCKTDLVAPVCGSDNVTYSSECLLRLASCHQQQDVYVRLRRECHLQDPCAKNECQYGATCKPSLDGRTYECVCPEKCSISGSLKARRTICASDGVEYASVCEMKRASCIAMQDIQEKYIGKCDPCEGVECPQYQVCSLDDDRNPICRCRGVCTSAYQPVCGSDGKDYANRCELDREACLNRRNLTVVHEGLCLERSNTKPCQQLKCSNYQHCRIDSDGQAACVCPAPCQPIMRPVCGSDGKSYDSECHLQREACLMGLNVTIKHAGPCHPEGETKCSSVLCDFGAVCNIDPKTGEAGCKCLACTDEYEPVCGDDGITYSNPCKLKRESCEKRKAIQVQHHGLCGGCENQLCPFYSICETDGEGRSQCVCPESCVSINDPVCSCDGRTYSSECEMRVESCKQQTYLTVKSKGKCDECLGIECNKGAICRKGKCVCQSDCPESTEWVCASNGVSYRSECEMLRSSCSSGIDLSIKFYGECKENRDGETAIDYEKELSYDPCSIVRCGWGSICDSKNRSARCVCEFNCQKSENSTETDIVCASNHVFYGNECMMREAACRMKTSLQVVDAKFCKISSVTAVQCEESVYGCCSDGITASLGPSLAGCPDTCNCNKLGSTSSSCDPVSKQCSCKPGVGGLKCDRCEPGFWGIHRISEGNSGCVPCGCNSHGSVRDDCEQTTGRCVCKTGALGMKCDTCQDGLALTGRGCLPSEKVESQETCGTNGECRFGAKCKDSDDGAKCSCDFSCEDSGLSPVCGSDNNTYGSECQMRLLSCRQQVNITIIKLSSCEVSSTNSTIASSALTEQYMDKELPQLDARYSSFTGQHSAKSPANSFEIPLFTGNSYILLPTIKRKNDLFVELEFTAREYNGILLFNGQKTGKKGDYVAILLRDGYPQFRYNLGSGDVVIISQHRIELNKKVKLVAKRHFKDGFLVVDDLDTAKGSSNGAMKTLDLDGPLYLGNIPRAQLASKELAILSGFFGCITKLKLNHKLIALDYQNSSHIMDTYRVENCKSSDCLDNDNCHADGPKCKDFSSEYSSNCTYSLQHDQPENVVHPDFAKTSFIKLVSPRNMLHAFDIEIWFFPRASNGLLLYAGPKSKEVGDFISLSLKDGLITFSFNLGSGPVVISVPKIVALNKWHVLKATRHGKNGTLQLDDSQVFRGQSKGSFNELNIKNYIFIGGIQAREAEKPLIGNAEGFDGAIQRITINRQSYKAFSKIVTRMENVKQFHGYPCSTEGKSICFNGGICEANLNEYSCHCPTGFTGPNCERSLSNDNAAIQFDGLYYGKFKKVSKRGKRSPKQSSIDMVFKSSSENGLLAWKGRGTKFYDNYIILALIDGYLEFTNHPGRGTKPLRVKTKDKVNDGRWHFVNIGWNKSMASLNIDNKPYFTSQSNSKRNHINKEGSFWIAGHPSLPKGLSPPFYAPFMGCISSLKIDGEKVLWSKVIKTVFPIQHCQV